MNHIPAFAFPAEAGTHLPTPEGWKAELALENHIFFRITAVAMAKDNFIDLVS